MARGNSAARGFLRWVSGQTVTPHTVVCIIWTNGTPFSLVFSTSCSSFNIMLTYSRSCLFLLFPVEVSVQGQVESTGTESQRKLCYMSALHTYIPIQWLQSIRDSTSSHRMLPRRTGCSRVAEQGGKVLACPPQVPIQGWYSC
jgi:hypothetical protein